MSLAALLAGHICHLGVSFLQHHPLKNGYTHLCLLRLNTTLAWFQPPFREGCEGAKF